MRSEAAEASLAAPNVKEREKVEVLKIKLIAGKCSLGSDMSFQQAPNSVGERRRSASSLEKVRKKTTFLRSSYQPPRFF